MKIKIFDGKTQVSFFHFIGFFTISKTDHKLIFSECRLLINRNLYSLYFADSVPSIIVVASNSVSCFSVDNILELLWLNFRYCFYIALYKHWFTEYNYIFLPLPLAVLFWSFQSKKYTFEKIMLQLIEIAIWIQISV